ncbi:hypothetical protein M9Y10_027617 [Tritrichomonas musculus]|uniref:RRM domain-containing protein n=1 Tax=Tritrichomonas musculus TaxID=1915356 RepID=A0ABR2H3Q4_9EUKA
MDKKSLIAFNIPIHVTEKEVEDAFSVKSDYYFPKIDIEFHKISNQKSAIISFNEKYIANKAFREMNQKEVNNIFYDLIYADDDTKEFLKSNKKILFFKIKKSQTQANDINNMFQKFGPIIEIHFDKTNHFGYVRFENTEKALKAKNELDNNNNNMIEIDFKSFDKTISNLIKSIKKLRFNNYDLKKGNNSSIFVFDIPQNIDKEFLYELFGVLDIESKETDIIFDKRFDYDSKSVNYAIITFKTREEALKAISELNYTKLDNVPIRLVLADDETRSILATNKGKLLILNLDPEIEVSQLHDAFSNFGEVIECEIPRDNGVSRGYGYVHFRIEEDAKQAKEDLKDASINGKPIEIKFMDDPDENDLQKQFLMKTDIKKINNEEDLNVPKSILLSLPIFDENDNLFTFYVNKYPIFCYCSIASFLSPKIAYNILNDEFFSSFKIKVSQLDRCESNAYEIVPSLIFLLKKNTTRQIFQIHILKTIHQIISSIMNCNFESEIEKIIDNCSEYLLGKPISDQENDDNILNFIAFIEIFSQLANESIIQYSTLLLSYKINQSGQIKNDQVLYMKSQVRKILKNSDEQEEIHYIQEHFCEIDPYILNEIDFKTIEKAVLIRQDKGGLQDKFLYKILRLRDDYKKYLISFVNFQRISNKAMKFFLASTDFSILNEKNFIAISQRLLLFINKSRCIDNNLIKKMSDIFMNFMTSGFQNSISKNTIENKNFIFYFSNKKIEFKRKIACIISPAIIKCLQADITFSSFYLMFDSQIDLFREFVDSLAYFSSEKKIDDFDKTTIENKVFDHLTQLKKMIEKEGIGNLQNFVNRLYLDEKNIFNYACWIWLFMSLSNNKFAEALINRFVESSKKEITCADDVLELIHHKDVLKCQNALNIDISREKEYIICNIDDFLSNILTFDDINEDLWRIISIRLSVDVFPNYV